MPPTDPRVKPLRELEVFTETMRAKGGDNIAFADWYHPVARGYIEGLYHFQQRPNVEQSGDLQWRIQSAILRSLALSQASLWIEPGGSHQENIDGAIELLLRAIARLEKERLASPEQGAILQ